VGAVYQATATFIDEHKYPPPGELVDVGGYRLHINCIGEGSPTVVMDSGLPGSSLDWSLVQSEVAEFTRVCAYDRAGFGWSDPGPTPRTS
jgi:pimeloyl-ACP methyl ester carboxylesterase